MAATSDDSLASELGVPTTAARRTVHNSVTLSAQSPANSGRSSTAAVRIINCHGKWDYPHSSSTDDKKTINAHLTINCTGPNAGSTHLSVGVAMTDGKRWSKTRRKYSDGHLYTASGVLKCLSKKRSYQAVGAIDIEFPTGYSPHTKQLLLDSRKVAFKKNKKGVCVKP